MDVGLQDLDLEVQDGMRGGTSIIHGPDGYSYHLNKTMKGGRVYIRCYRYYRWHCKGAASLDPDDGDFRRTSRHNHLPDDLQRHERRFRHSVLDRCRDPDEVGNFHDIYHEERRRLRIPDMAAAQVPFVKLRPAMQAARAQGKPNLPHTLSELATLLQQPQFQELSATLDDADNLFAGVVGQSAQRTRCVLFFSRRMLHYMRKVKKVFSDGTFVVPLNLGCSQIWALTTVRNNALIVLGWALMQSRLTEAYIAVLRALHQLQPRFRPTQVMCDFESAEQAGWEAVYPNAERHGCYFHHSKRTCEQANELHLTPFLRENLQADSIMRSLCAIPLLHTDNLLMGFESVLRRATRRGLQQMTPIFEYYLRTWLSPSKRRILSVYDCEDRTNNVCESHNRTLRGLVRVDHPNIFQLISAFARYEDIMKIDLLTLGLGDPPNRNRRISSIINDRRYAGLTADLEAGHISIGRFLRSASYRIQRIYNAVLG